MKVVVEACWFGFANSGHVLAGQDSPLSWLVLQHLLAQSIECFSWGLLCVSTRLMQYPMERAEQPASDGSDVDAARGEQPLLHVSRFSDGSVGKGIPGRQLFPALLAACGLIAGACWLLPRHTMLRGSMEGDQAIQLSAQLFQPVDGGVSRACRGGSPNDNSPTNFQLSSAADLAFCQWECLKMPTCQGVEYHPSNWRCELWTRPGGIQATAQFQPSECYRRLASLEPVDGGDDRACRGATTGDNNPVSYIKTYSRT